MCPSLPLEAEAEASIEHGMTLKSGLGVIEGHWKWHHSIDRIRVPIRLPL